MVTYRIRLPRIRPEKAYRPRHRHQGHGYRITGVSTQSLASFLNLKTHRVENRRRFSECVSCKNDSMYKSAMSGEGDRMSYGPNVLRADARGINEIISALCTVAP